MGDIRAKLFRDLANYHKVTWSEDPTTQANIIKLMDEKRDAAFKLLMLRAANFLEMTGQDRSRMPIDRTALTSIQMTFGDLNFHLPTDPTVETIPTSTDPNFFDDGDSDCAAALEVLDGRWPCV
ncbi:MAG: hypothetical protein AAGF20_08585 [Pseudomonadota bacterium]